MPTPFMHLQMAERILASSKLGPEERVLILSENPAFYLGNVAPDFQTINDIPREETHFYKLPPAPNSKAYDLMMRQYPQLADIVAMSPAQAVFVAAYCVHLMLDLRWYNEVLIPYFLVNEGWSDHRQRFIVHNTLLTYLDMLAVESLPDSAAGTLIAAQPDHWLPFADDGDLIGWRDMLVAQLRPGAILRTIEIYAGRLSMSPEEFAANLEDPSWMEGHVFSKAPLEKVKGMLFSAVDDSVDIITNYLNGTLL
jgi:hypothetical protein